jgi:hypothetical protein
MLKDSFGLDTGQLASDVSFWSFHLRYSAETKTKLVICCFVFFLLAALSNSIDVCDTVFFETSST